MSVNLQHDRWSVSPAEFAVKVMIPDLKGFFGSLPIIGSVPKSRSLVIEPGTRALVIDDGILVGEVPPGEYTLPRQSLLMAGRLSNIGACPCIGFLGVAEFAEFLAPYNISVVQGEDGAWES